MPGFRFEKSFKKSLGPLGGIRASFGLAASVTRETPREEPARDGALEKDTAKDQERDRARKLEAAEREIERQRGLLAEKERQITRLRMRASTGGRKQSGGRPDPSGTGVGVLPDFLILGTQKGGTTLLYYLLNQHPYVEPATKKEINFFDVNFSKGEDWYRSHFPAPTVKDGVEIISGEASPYYLYHPHAARRAARTVPEARLISLLRDPVERAYSEYHHRYREGRETLGFEEAVEAEESRLDGELERMLADEHYASPNHRKFSYLSRGIYVDQLQEWHRHFDEGQLLVIGSGEFFRDPRGVLKRAVEFLSLPEWEPEENLLNYTSVRHEGDYAPIPEATRRRLEEFFRPSNERLYEYLGEDFGW